MYSLVTTKSAKDAKKCDSQFYFRDFRVFRSFLFFGRQGHGMPCPYAYRLFSRIPKAEASQ